MISIIYVIFINYNKIYKSKYSGLETSFFGFVTKINIDGNKLSLEIVEKEKLIVNYYIKTQEEKEYIINNYKVGNYIKVNGTMKNPSINTNFNTFNYKKYLLSKKIFWIIDCNNIEIINHKNLIYSIKNLFIKRINGLKSGNYIKMFIFAINDLDEDIYNNYKQNGVIHIVAISGMHISFLSSILLFIFNKLIKNEYIVLHNP